MAPELATANLPTKILDLRGLDSSILFIKRDGIPRPIGSFPESLSRQILAGIILVGKVGRMAPELAMPARTDPASSSRRILASRLVRQNVKVGLEKGGVRKNTDFHVNFERMDFGIS